MKKSATLLDVEVFRHSFLARILDLIFLKMYRIELRTVAKIQVALSPSEGVQEQVL